MKTFFLFLFLLTPAAWLCAQDINILLKEAGRLEFIPNESEAFAKYKEVLRINPLNLNALSRCSELCSRIGKRQPDNKSRDSYYQAARIYAATALKIDPLNTDASCAMAMALGRATMSKSSREKINDVKEIRKYVDISLHTDPNNFKAWHVLGRWHYELSNLNIFERAAVKLFFGGLPASSLKLSILSFEKSRSIQPEFILNYLELAKAYHRNDQDQKAREILRTMLTYPNQTEDDPEIKEDGKKMLKVLR